MSIGFFVEEDEAVVWRGPMLHKALTQFLEDVAWGELDYLLIDLPPGTGDVSMTLAQLLPQAKFVIVTTPQPAAQKVARRSAEMADKVKLEIAGVIENMSGFTTPSGERFPIFGEGGGGRLADELDVPLLGKVPLTMPLREQADAGTPLVFADPDDPAAQAIRQAARGLVALSPIELPVMQAPAPPAAPSRSACRCRWPEPARRLEAALAGRRRGRSRRRHGQQRGVNAAPRARHRLGDRVDDRARAGRRLERLQVHLVHARSGRQQRDRGERPARGTGVSQRNAQRGHDEEQVDRGQRRGHAETTEPSRQPEVRPATCRRSTAR